MYNFDDIAQESPICADIFSIVMEYLDPVNDVLNMYYVVPIRSNQGLDPIFINRFTNAAYAYDWSELKLVRMDVNVRELIKCERACIDGPYNTITPGYATYLLDNPHPRWYTRPRNIYGAVYGCIVLVLALLISPWFLVDLLSPLFTMGDIALVGNGHQPDIDDKKTWVCDAFGVLITWICCATHMPVWITSLIKATFALGETYALTPKYEISMHIYTLAEVKDLF
jgi:hypothetical protein